MEKLVSGLIFVLSFPCLPKSGLLQWCVYLRYFFGFFCRCFFSLRLKCNRDWFLFLDFISNVLITRSHFHIAIFLLFFFTPGFLLVLLDLLLILLGILMLV